MQGRVSTVINYCSIEAPFIRQVVAQARLFSDDVIVSAYDRLFDGTPEDSGALRALEGPGVRVVVQEWSADKPPKYWHNAARWAGVQAARHDWVLFLDADEVPEGGRMREWFTMNDLRGRSYDAYSFGCYWYFREPIYRATQEFECAVLLHKRCITRDLIFSEKERWEFRRHPDIRALDHVVDAAGPMFHHYSWVRTKAQLLKKVSSWAHKDDRNWAAFVEEEFSRPFNGTDFVHGFSYTTVKNIFTINPLVLP